MTWPEEIAGAFEVEAEPGFGPPTVDVERDDWVTSLVLARDRLGCSFFDYLTAVDELDEGFRIVAHLARIEPGHVDSVVVRTLVPREGAEVGCACDVYAGAAWHERETHEMFGIGFSGHGELETLLLPDGFEGNPLRKDFVLASRVAKPWPGAKEPGESDGDAAPSRRRTRPPGVPDPDEWGPAAESADDEPPTG